jgi:acyl-coenzyme A thioesterase PaaI-like protein
VKYPRHVSATLGGLALLGTLSGAATAAKADTASTAAIVAGAAAIVGALLYDSNSRPYYVRNDHRYYVTQGEAQYYRSHHRGVVRRAYVPEQEYPVARDPYRGNGGGRGYPNGNR